LEEGGRCLSWIFIRDTDKVEEGLMVLFFGLVFFSLLPSPGNFSADALVPEFTFSVKRIFEQV